MKTNRYLLPRSFKRIGWALSIPSAIVLLTHFFSGGVHQDTFMGSLFNTPYLRVVDVMCWDNILLAIFMFLLMVGLLFIAFSREKTEDEYITKLRGDSLIWAVVVNAILMAVLSVTVYDGWFVFVSFFNLYTTLVLFIVKFHIVLNSFNKEMAHEE